MTMTISKGNINLRVQRDYDDDTRSCNVNEKENWVFRILITNSACGIRYGLMAQSTHYLNFSIISPTFVQIESEKLQ